MTYRGTAFSMRSKRWLIDHLFDEKLQAAAQHIHGRVLDIGCGTRRYRDLLPGGRYVGFDRSGPVDVRGDARLLPFAAASIDTALCFQVLDDVSEPLQFLREIHRVLKPSGTLLLSVDLSWRVHDAPNDYFRFTCYGLVYLATQAGFRVDSVEPLGGLWALVANRIAYRVYERMGAHRLFGPFAWLTGCAILLCGAAADRLDFRPEDTKGYFVRTTRWPEGLGTPPQPEMARAFSV
jgi:SAM-dependent methyltransferase